jgi:hypothetical protein
MPGYIAGNTGLGVPASFTSACQSNSTTSLRQTRMVRSSRFSRRIAGFEFNMWNPLYAFAPVVLLMISIPLAIFATVTTTIALSLLALRAFVVYVQLTVAILGAWLDPPPLKSPYLRSPQPPSTYHALSTSPENGRNNASSVHAHNLGVITAQASRTHTKSDSLSSLLGTSEFTKDFEGVGGWRDPGDAKEEALWMGMNSRLELPADVSPRRHRRSLTGGAIPNQRWSWSPIQSRARTPVRMSLEEGRDYFPTNPAATMRPLAHAFELGK